MRLWVISSLPPGNNRTYRQRNSKITTQTNEYMLRTSEAEETQSDESHLHQWRQVQRL